MVDRDQHPSREDEIRRAVFGQVDLQTAELEIVSSIYDGFAAAILVKGQPRTIALTREYGDAVQLMAMIERSRSAQPAASEAGAAAGEGPQPVCGEIRVIDGNRCRFIERELEGDKWEVIGPADSDPAASPERCNGCGHVGPVPKDKISCCPDGRRYDLAPEGGAVLDARAVATREEAPAGNVTILVTKAQRDAARNSGKKLNDWIGGVLQRAVAEAPAEAGEAMDAGFEAWLNERNLLPHGAWDWPSIVAMLNHHEDALRARSSAPEALGNLLAVIHGDGGHRALEVGTKQAALEAEKIVAGLLAAPSADKLRDHLEWIETVLTDPVPGYTARIATAREYIDQALAALQADQGAK